MSIGGGLLACLIVGTLAGPANERRLGKAGKVVFAEKRLWILSDEGRLQSVGNGENERRDEAVPAPVLGMCVRNRALVIVTRADAPEISLQLRKHAGKKWLTEGAAIVQDDDVVEMDCSRDVATLLTKRHVVQIARGKTKVSGEHWFPEVGGYTVVTSILALDDTVLVGLNSGEWGGGMVRIDMGSGTSKRVERAMPDSNGSTPLDSKRDPVNAIKVAPWNPSCVIAAVGLVHRLSHGRLLEICGDEIRVLYRGTPITPYMATEPFYGLVRSGDMLLAAAGDGLYRVAKAGATPTSLPRFKQWRGLSLSFDVPGVIVIGGGGVPALIPR